MVCFQIVLENVSKMVPGRGGGKLQFNVVFLTWMHFGRQGLPMELPSDFQEHFYTILTRFGHTFGSLFAQKKRNHKKQTT